MYAEVIYETGSHSVVAFDDQDTLKAALADQNKRAQDGKAGGPTGHAAERVKRVLLYKEHPGDFGESGMVPVDMAIDAVQKTQVGDQVSIWEVINALRETVTPLTLKLDTGAHDSMYLAGAYDELDLSGM